MKIRELRFFTAVAVMGLSAFAVLQGADIVGFRIATGALNSATRAATLRTWYAVPGVGSLAREAALPLTLDTSNRDTMIDQRDALREYLAVRPASSLQWLMLGASRLLLGASMDSVIAAYGLSVITGPNENDVIVERAKFGLYLWNDLPADLKKREIDDLTLGNFSGPEKENLRKLVASMNASNRAEVVNALPKQRLSVLGIEP